MRKILGKFPSRVVIFRLGSYPRTLASVQSFAPSESLGDERRNVWLLSPTCVRKLNQPNAKRPKPDFFMLVWTCLYASERSNAEEKMETHLR